MSFNQIVIPIFYDVDPTDVRKQQNSFGEAMAKHKQRMEAETNAEKRSQLVEQMESWKRALTQVADLKGKDAKNMKETKLIEEVVTDIHRRLGVLLSNTLPHIVGMDGYVNSISSWLTDGSCHNILTIVGMSGIGKTSLAKYVFRLHCAKFPKSSFIEGIGTRCKEKFNGLLDLQKQLHGDISKKLKLNVNDVSLYTSMIENALVRKRVFIVLDDINSLDQMDALLGNKGLHPESKIIITTTDASLAKSCSLFNPQVQSKHTQILLNGLCESESLQLLCIHAFKSRYPKEGYGDVSKELVKYCEGHPLALEVLGRSLHNKNVADWEDYIKELKKEPHFRINNALKLSFESLPFKNDKELFKHIACFFVGEDRDFTETILEECEIKTRSGIQHLIERCLLSIGWNNELIMHQLVQEMGRDLVRQESPDGPWKRSRVWCHEESLKVLQQNEGTENLIGLAFDMRLLEKEKLTGSLQLKTDALNKMKSLKLLRLDYVKISGSYQNISKELRWLCMRGFQFQKMPSDLPMENLVALDMSHSNIESFDMSYSYSQHFLSGLKRLTGSSLEDKPVLGSLKILDLSFCEKLCSVGGFLELPALERLIIRNCIGLIEVCESVEQCAHLVYIDLRYCYKLKKVPISIRKLKKVKTLLLDGCNSFESQIKRWSMNSSHTSINLQNSSSAILGDLKFFSVYLPRSLRVLSIANNNLSNESFPMDFSCLSMLEVLCLCNNPIVSMPHCVRTLPRLKELGMSNCEMLISIEHPPPTLRSLVVSVGLDEVPFEPGHRPCVRKIKFDTEMSPLWLNEVQEFPVSAFEIEGMVKIEAMSCVELKILHSLGWKNLDSIKEKRLRASSDGNGSTESETQMYYEFGIFSTIYKGEDMPDWIKYRSNESSISLTVPSSPKKLQGLNLSYVVTVDSSSHVETVDSSFTVHYYFQVPEIKISNDTIGHTWIYKHYLCEVAIGGKGSITMLSHWMFGPDEMKAGDHITITLIDEFHVRSWNDYFIAQHTKECGISFVYEDDAKNEGEDVLGYYKSWNHIIGGDLSAFQLKTGEYLLHHKEFWRQSPCHHLSDHPHILHLIDVDAKYKEKGLMGKFRAFSQKKNNKSDEVDFCTSRWS